MKVLIHKATRGYFLCENPEILVTLKNLDDLGDLGGIFDQSYLESRIFKAVCHVYDEYKRLLKLNLTSTGVGFLVVSDEDAEYLLAHQRKPAYNWVPIFQAGST